MSRLFYYVQPSYEPYGPDGGWDDADSDAQATTFFVVGQDLDNPFNYTKDATADTRADAQDIADAWNARFGMMQGEGPTEAESCSIKRAIRLCRQNGAMPEMAGALETAFPNETSEVYEESENNA